MGVVTAIFLAGGNVEKLFCEPFHTKDVFKASPFDHVDPRENGERVTHFLSLFSPIHAGCGHPVSGGPEHEELHPGLILQRLPAGADGRELVQAKKTPLYVFTSTARLLALYFTERILHQDTTFIQEQAVEFE